MLGCFVSGGPVRTSGSQSVPRRTVRRRPGVTNQPMRSTDTNKARIGIPWRTSAEEAANERPRIQSYADAVLAAGGEPVLLSLRDGAGFEAALAALDGFVLPGSPADVEPAEYGAKNRGLSEPSDLPRERADRAILGHALKEQKPVLAICYGCQLLNVYRGGTLIQDLRSETGTTVPHRKKDVSPDARVDPQHPVKLVPGSLLARLAGGTDVVVNSSHHQSVEKAGRDLRVTGVSTADGIVEGLEWTGDANWIVGVQWHPERLKGDALADRLFAELVASAQKSGSNRRAAAES